MNQFLSKAYQAFFLFILIAFVPTKVFSESEKFLFGPKKKMHFLPIKMTPKDSYMASQVTKIVLRVLYQTGKYHLIIGDRPEYKKIVIGVETIAVWSKRTLDKYDITITWREQRKGKILKRLRAISVERDDYLTKVESLLSRIFLPETYTKDSTIIIDRRKKKPRTKSTSLGGVEIVKREEKIETNVVVLTPEELELKRTDPVRYYQERAKKRKQKQWGNVRKQGKKKTIIIPEDEELVDDTPEIIAQREEKSRPKTIQVPIKKEEKKKEPAPKVLPKPRKPYFVRAGLILEHESLVSNDLLKDVKSSIMRYGVFAEPRVWKFNENSHVFAQGSLVSYFKKAIFRETKKRLPDEWMIGLGYRHSFFKNHLSLSAGTYMSNRSWGNLGRLFGRDSEGNTITYGIEVGTFKTLEARVDMDLFFNLFGYRHGLGGSYHFPLTQEASYIGNKYSNMTSSQFQVHYDFFLSQGTRIRLGYKKRTMELKAKAVDYDSSIILGQFIIDMNI